MTFCHKCVGTDKNGNRSTMGVECEFALHIYGADMVICRLLGEVTSPFPRNMTSQEVEMLEEAYIKTQSLQQKKLREVMELAEKLRDVEE